MDDLSTGVVRRPGVQADALPALCDLLGQVNVLCLSEDQGYAEHELAPHLVRAGFHVRILPMEAGGMSDVASLECDLVLFDITSHAERSYEICANLRRALRVPLMLVLRGAARDDILRGYAAGADGYILAPFDGREFVARLGGLLRRQPSPRPAL